MPREINLDSLMPKPLLFNKKKAGPKKEVPNVVEGFGEVLKDALSEVNRLRRETDLLTQKLVTGEIENVHDVMIAAQKAGIATEMTIQIRNAAIRAYDELMRMR
jgi:flagellar hook-basal body complex protein FliE